MTNKIKIQTTNNGVTGQRPATPFIGEQFYNTDYGYIEIYTIAGWRQFQPIVVGNGARPTYFPQGYMVYDAQIGKPIWYHGGGHWHDANGAEV